MNRRDYGIIEGSKKGLAIAGVIAGVVCAPNSLMSGWDMIQRNWSFGKYTPVTKEYIIQAENDTMRRMLER